MAASKNYSKVQRYYESGRWTLDMVEQAVVKGWITKTEFKTITGEKYSA